MAEHALSIRFGGEKHTLDAKVSSRVGRYGVSGIGQSASALTRLWDSVGMTAQVGTDGDNSNVVNNFDDVAPFNRRKCVGTWYMVGDKPVFRVNAYLGDDDYTEDGTNGDYVAVECPRAYYYFKDGILGVSAHQYSGWQPFDIFCRNHDPEDTMPYYYAPAYAMGVDENGQAASRPGLDNAQGNYYSLLTATRTYQSGALGTNAIMMPAAYNFYEWALYTVEFAQQNCQNIMYGCGGLRHNGDDRVTFLDATHLLTNNYYAARASGEFIAVITASSDINAFAYLATHQITGVMRCDENGNASSTGTHQLLTVEDLGRNYFEYDLTGATQYRIAARPYRTGYCNSVSTPSGSPISNTNGYYPCKYRWHENPFGNQYKTTVDLFNQRVGTGDSDYYLKWFYLTDPASYTPSASTKPDATDLATSLFEELDIVTDHGDYANGYIVSKKYSGRYPNIWIPFQTTGGSITTYFADYAYLVSSSAVRSCRLGGCWTNGAAVGFSFALANSAPSISYAYYGCDLFVAHQG